MRGVRTRPGAARAALFAVLAGTLTTMLPATAAAGCTSQVVYVAAHEDDTLLFLSPDLLHDVQAGACVTTIYLTAGDNGWGTDHMALRENATDNAYAEMAGVSDTWTRTTTSAGGHSIVTDTLQGNPNIKQLFMRLPDGNTDGSGFSANHFESLLKLWNGSITTIHPIDGTPGYTLQNLRDTLLALMNTFQPTAIRTQDYVGYVGDNDHSDHHVTAYVVRQVSQSYQTQHSLTGYLGYDSEYRAQNVTGADLTAKYNAFLAYDAVDDVCNPSCTGTQYDSWLKRQYVTGSETGPLTNQAPVADAGPAQTVNLGATVTLDGSASRDPEGAPLTYSWTQTAGPAVTLSSTTAVQPTFTAPTTATSLSFQLVVNDGTLNSAPSSVTITVTSVNHAPTANAGAAQTVGTGSTVTLDGSASTDPDGNPLTYAWSQTSGTAVTLSSATAVKPTFTAPSTAGSLTFQLVVNDGLTDSAPSTVTITVTSGTVAANIASSAAVSASSEDVADGQQAVKAVDGVVDGYPHDSTKEWATVGGKAGSWLKLAWSSSMTISKVVLHDRINDTDQITAGNLAVDSGAKFTFGTLPNDGTGLNVALPNVATKSLTMNVTSVAGGTVNIGLAEIEVWAVPTNLPPVANAGPAQSVALGAAVTLDGSASYDPEGQGLTYQWTQTGGPAVTLSGATTAKPSFTAPSSSVFLTFQLVVNDGQLASTPSNVTITVGSPNYPPVADAGANQTVNVGATVTLDGSASHDPDGGTLTYRWSQTGGTGVTLSSTTAVKPTFTAPMLAGTLTFQLVVNDGQVDSSPSTVAVTVTDPNPLRGWDVQASNSGTLGKMTSGDALTLTYTKPLDLTSVMAGWSGGAQNVVLRARDATLVGLSGANDTADVFTTTGLTTPVNLGSVNLKGNYVKASQTVLFNATMTASTATVNGTAATVIRVQLGTVASGGTQLASTSTTPTMVWQPSAGAKDTYGNPCATTSVTESGTADRDF